MSNPKQFQRRLRLFTYVTFIVSWATAGLMVKHDKFLYFTDAPELAVLVTVMAWSIFGSAGLLWKHRRDVAERAKRAKRAPAVPKPARQVYYTFAEVFETSSWYDVELIDKR